MTMTGVTAAAFEKPEVGFDQFATEHVTPLVSYLASEGAANISGNVFVVWGKEIAVLGHPNATRSFKSIQLGALTPSLPKSANISRGNGPSRIALSCPVRAGNSPLSFPSRVPRRRRRPNGSGRFARLPERSLDCRRRVVAQD